MARQSQALFLASLMQIVDQATAEGAARDDARRQILQAVAVHEDHAASMRSSPLLAEARSGDPWTSRARPAFLYVMYAFILWAFPMGLIAALSPGMARAIAGGMTDYLTALPEPLYALFGTGYLGYATLRQWGKAKGTDS